jgi:hypothetical protein
LVIAPKHALPGDTCCLIQDAPPDPVAEMMGKDRSAVIIVMKGTLEDVLLRDGTNGQAGGRVSGSGRCEAVG